MKSQLTMKWTKQPSRISSKTTKIKTNQKKNPTWSFQMRQWVTCLPSQAVNSQIATSATSTINDSPKWETCQFNSLWTYQFHCLTETLKFSAIIPLNQVEEFLRKTSTLRTQWTLSRGVQSVQISSSNSSQSDPKGSKRKIQALITVLWSKRSW